MTSVETPVAFALAGDVMSAPPLTVGPDASVKTAWSLMRDRGVRHLLVTQDERCVGIVDDRTIFAQWPLGPAALRCRPVAAVMRAMVPCVPTDSELCDVAAVMLRECLDAVPVVDADGRAVGIVTCSDVLCAVASSAGGHDDIRSGT